VADLKDLNGDEPARIDRYATLLVERCLDVQPGMQVVIRTTPLARPLLQALRREIAQRGAYAIVRMGFETWPANEPWAAEAPLELLGELAPVDRFLSDEMDARMTIEAPENTAWGSDLPPERIALSRKAEAYFLRRSTRMEIPWVSCQFPTNALAQEAGMPLVEFEDLLYDACLRDWDAEGERMRRYVGRFDDADEIRIVGAETDLRVSLRGRRGEVDDGHVNMPGGEFFFSPVEDSAQGTILFDVPTQYQGTPVEGIRLRFEQGRVVEASASRGEATLLAALETDEGARFLGELGIGCNPGIVRPARNILFDEKMAGTVHLAVGQSYPTTGGTNVSSVHWDLIKDLRDGGRIELDGEVVQQDGRWRV
jgi:aminopeptidase